MWLRDYHVDGLRLDAVHALHDTNAVHLLEDIATLADCLSPHVRRPLSLIAESDLNDPKLITAREIGGFGLTAQWNDDFHHVVHVALTGETVGYYADFGPVSAIAKVITRGFFHDGTYSSYRGRDHGRPVDTLVTPSWRFVAYTQNHDQIGNRAAGDRLSAHLSRDELALAAVLVLTSPFTPMLFMGEEWAARTPWAFFVDNPNEEMARATREGRVAEFERMGWNRNEIPDPQDEQTFVRSKLDWSEPEREDHREMLELYRDLIALRRSGPSSPTLGSAATTSSSTTTSAGCSSTGPACGSRSTCPPRSGRCRSPHPLARCCCRPAPAARWRATRCGWGRTVLWCWHHPRHDTIPRCFRRPPLDLRRPARSALPGLGRPAGAARSSRERCSRDADSTGRRRISCCRRCGTGPPSSVTGASTARRRPTARCCARRPVASCPSATRPASPPVTSSSGSPSVRRAAGARVRDVDGGVRRMGERPRIARRLLMEDHYRAARRRLGRAHGRRRAGRRPVELRRREPRAAAEAEARPRATGHRDLGRARAVVAGRGRDRRARCAATSTAGNATVTSPSSASTGHAASPPPAPRRWRRLSGSSPNGCRRSGRYEDAMLAGDPVDGALPAVRAAQSRTAGPAGGRAAGGAGLPEGRRPHRRRRRDSSARSSAGATTCGTCTGISARTSGVATRLARGDRFPRGSPSCDADAVEARCLSSVLRDLREHGWVHHIPRLMVLGNYALQRGWDPVADDRLVPPGVRRRLRLGDDAERHRHVAVRGRRQDRDQALRQRRRVHRPDERLLRWLPLPAGRPRRRGRLPVHRGVLVIPASPPGGRSRATTGWRNRCAASTGSPTSPRSSSRSGHADRHRPSGSTPPCRRSLRVRFGSRSAPAQADRAEQPPRPGRRSRWRARRTAGRRSSWRGWR